MRDFANSQVRTWALGLTGRVGIAMLFAALLTFLGPFNTYRFDFIQRIGYWTMLMTAWLMLWLVASGLLSKFSVLRKHNDMWRRVGAIVLTSLPMVVVVGVATNMMAGWEPTPANVAVLYVQVLLIGAALTYVSDMFAASLMAPVQSLGAPPDPAVTTPADEPLPDEAPGDTSFVDRLPPHIRNDILCLQVEDHYVRVHSRQSSVMVLIRFSDALRGIEHIPGSQVHRSWWVADGAVESLRRTGRTAQLTLCNGTSVPVSQPYVSHAINTWSAVLV